LLGGPDVTPKQIYKVNLEGTKNILKASVENKVKRFIYLSAGAVMGKCSKMANENTKCKPITPYAKSKFEGERLSLKYFKEYDFPVTIIRSTMVYGPGETKNKLRMIRAIKKGFFRIIGSGKNKISWVYIDNLIEGIILATESKKAIGEIYIISDKNPYSMNEMVKTISKELGVKTPQHIPKWIAWIVAVFFEITSKILKFSPPLFRDRILSLTEGHMLDCFKACNEIGYNPKIGLKQGMKRTIDYYKKNGLLD